MPRVLFMRLVRPALTPVMTAKLRACWNGPPIFNIGLAAAPVIGDGERETGVGVSTKVNDDGREVAVSEDEILGLPAAGSAPIVAMAPITLPRKAPCEEEMHWRGELVGKSNQINRMHESFQHTWKLPKRPVDKASTQGGCVTTHFSN